MKQKKRLRGSYTVEAAFLIPMGIGLILFVISSALFLRDKVTACAWVHEAAAWEGFQKRAEESRDFSASFLLVQAEEQVGKNDREVTVMCRGEGEMLSALVKSMFILGKFRVEEQESVERVYGEQAVRLRGFSEGVYTNGSDL